MKAIFLSTFSWLSLLLSLPAAESRTLLRDGLFAEEAKQDHATAIQKYTELLGQFKKERQVAVVALYRLAEIHRKQGQALKAAELYRQLLDEFPGIEPQNRMSRENLMAMGEQLPELMVHVMDEESKELQRIQKLGVTSPDRLKESELFESAIQKGYIRVIRYLIEQEVDVNQSDFLSFAVKQGNIQICQLLLDNGCDPNLEDNGDALQLAIENKYSQITALLLERGSHAKGSRGLFLARLSKDIPFSLWKKVVETGSDLNATAAYASKSHETSLLHAAVYHQRKDIITYLLDQKVVVNVQSISDRSTPLHVALFRKDSENVARLIQAGADVNSRLGKTNSSHSQHTPLMISIANDDIKSAKLLLQARANIPHGELAVLAGDGKLDWVKLLIAHGAELNPKGSLTYYSRNNPLLVAIRRDQQAMVTFLRSQGARLGEEQLSFLKPRDRIRWMEENQYPAFAKRSGVTLVLPELPWNHEYMDSGGDAYTAIQATLSTEIPRRVLDNSTKKQGGQPATEQTDLWKCDSAQFVLIRAGQRSVIDLVGGNFPEMRAGDILEVSRFDTKDEYTARRLSYDNTSNGLRELRHTRLRQILERGLRYPVFITRNGRKQEFVVTGQCSIYDIRKKELPMTSLSRTISLLQGWGHSITLKRQGWKPINLTDSSDEANRLSLQKNDEIIIQESSTAVKSTKDHIMVICEGLSWQRHIDISPTTPPTLFQVMTSLNHTISPYPWPLSSLDTRIEDLEPKEQAEVLALRFQRQILSSAYRNSSYLIGIYNIDFSNIIIERAGKAIQVDLDQKIKQWDGSTKSAKEGDVFLQSGDQLKLVLKEGPWLGFTQQQSDYLSKALTYSVVLSDENSKLSPRLIQWVSPWWLETPAGIFAIDRKDENTQTHHLLGKYWIKGDLISLRRGDQTLKVKSDTYWPRDGDDIRASSTRVKRIVSPRNR